MTKQLQNKIDQLSALLSSEKDRKKLTKKLQQEIAKLIDKQPDLPHRGDDAWFWHHCYAYYGPYLFHGTIEEIVWKERLKCFKAKIRCSNGRIGWVWKTLDRCWRTQKEAERWDLLREIKVAEHNLELAQQKLDELNKQLEEA